MNLITVLLMSVKRLSKALRFHEAYLYPQNGTHAYHFSNRCWQATFLFMVVVSVIFNQILVLKVLNCFDRKLNNCTLGALIMFI